MVQSETQGCKENTNVLKINSHIFKPLTPAFVVGLVHLAISVRKPLSIARLKGGERGETGCVRYYTSKKTRLLAIQFFQRRLRGKVYVPFYYPDLAQIGITGNQLTQFKAKSMVPFTVSRYCKQQCWG